MCNSCRQTLTQTDMLVAILLSSIGERVITTKYSQQKQLEQAATEMAATGRIAHKCYVVMVASGRCADETSPLSKGCRAHAFQKCSIWGDLDHPSNIRFLGLSLLLKSDYLRFSRFRTDYQFAQHTKSHVLNGPEILSQVLPPVRDL